MTVKKTPGTKKPVVRKAAKPAVRSNAERHTDDFEVDQPADMTFNAGVDLVGGHAIEPVAADALNKEYTEALAFMEELIEVVVSESTDENAENPVQVGVNGVCVYFWRGRPSIVKRKFVDALIVKSNRVRTHEVTLPDGSRSFKIEQNAALKYPFSVIRDNNPKGTEWLRQRINEVV